MSDDDMKAAVAKVEEVILAVESLDEQWALMDLIDDLMEARRLTIDGMAAD